MKQNVLITGGAGFIGSHLAENYKKYNVIIIDKPLEGFIYKKIGLYTKGSYLL